MSAGCTGPGPAPVGPVLVPDAAGLQPVGSPLRIDFGRAEAGVIAAVSRLTGADPSVRRKVPGCGQVVFWPDGLQLVFASGAFRGWAYEGRTAGLICG
ncbi:MAG: hypothetical protein QNJ16_06760 [Rhodobacter sp.]|nr:hypothetical protein [Rhodobacter sp.]